MCTERQRGFTLIELIVFIVIVGVALAGVLSVLNYTSRNSADPMIRKQALAIAEAVLEEVMLQPFTWCDPDDANVETAPNAAGCATTVEGLGAEGVESRGSALTPLDNVSDYNGLATQANVSGAVDALYMATVTVAQNSLNGIPATESLLITVSVAGAGGETVVLQGYRTRHSPNLKP